LAAYNIKRDGGAEIDDDCGDAMVGLRGEGVGETVFTDFLRLRVMDCERGAVLSG
jgi:hypothetical protein